MTTIGTMNFILGVNSDAVYRGMKQAKRHLADFSKNVTNNFRKTTKDAKMQWKLFATSAVSSIGLVRKAMISLPFLALSVGASVLAKSFLDTASAMEQLEMALDKLSQGRGESTFLALNRWAKDMPINTEKAISAFRLLKAYHLDPTLEDMTTIVDTVSALGGTTDILEGIARALGQIEAKGRPMQQEMNQLSERGVPALAILQQKLKLLPSQVADIGRQGLKSAEVLKALMAGMKEWAGGLSAMFMQTWRGQLERVKAWAMEFKRVVMNAGIFDSLKSGLEKFISWLESEGGQKQLTRWGKGIISITMTSFNVLSQLVLMMYSGMLKINTEVTRMALLWDKVKIAMEKAMPTKTETKHDESGPLMNLWKKSMTSKYMPQNWPKQWIRLAKEGIEAGRENIDKIMQAVERDKNLSTQLAEVISSKYENIKQIVKNYITEKEKELNLNFTPQLQQWANYAEDLYNIIKGWYEKIVKFFEELPGKIGDSFIKTIENNNSRFKKVVMDSFIGDIIEAFRSPANAQEQNVHENTLKTLEAGIDAKLARLEQNESEQKNIQQLSKDIQQFVSDFLDQIENIDKLPFFEGGGPIPSALGIGFALPGRAIYQDYANLLDGFNKLEDEKLDISAQKYLDWADNVLQVTENTRKEAKKVSDAELEAYKSALTPEELKAFDQLTRYKATPAHGFGPDPFNFTVNLDEDKGYLKKYEQFGGDIRKTMAAFFKELYPEETAKETLEKHKDFWEFLNKTLKATDQAKTMEEQVKLREDTLKELAKFEEQYGQGIPLRHAGTMDIGDAERWAMEIRKRIPEMANALIKQLVITKSKLAEQVFRTDMNGLFSEYDTKIAELKEDYGKALVATKEDKSGQSNLDKTALDRRYNAERAKIYDQYYGTELENIKNNTHYYGTAMENQYEIARKNVTMKAELLKEHYETSRYYFLEELKLSRDTALELNKIEQQAAMERHNTMQGLIMDLKKGGFTDEFKLERGARDKAGQAYDLMLQREQLEIQFKDYADDSQEKIKIDEWFKMEHNRIQEEINNVMVQAWDNSFQEMTSMMVDFIENGEWSWKKFANFAVGQILKILDAYTTMLAQQKALDASSLLNFGSSLFESGSSNFLGVTSSFSPTTGYHSAASKILSGPADIEFASGGLLNEPIKGIGVNSGASYLMGEVPEAIVPLNKLNQQPSKNVNLNVSISAVDAQSFERLCATNPGAITARLAEAIQAGDTATIGSIRSVK